MERIRERVDFNALRLFLWNEKLTRNLISPSEGLCVFIIKSAFITVQPCVCGCAKFTNTVEERKCFTVISFDLSKLLKKDSSLGSMLVSSTLQFLPNTIKQLGGEISCCLFNEFQDSLSLVLPPPHPMYVIALEISQTRCIDLTDNIDFNVFPNFTGLPPSVPLYRRFEIQEEVFTVRNVSSTDFRNDPYDEYTDYALEYLDTLREYTREAGIFPTKPPIVADVPRGFSEVQPCPTLTDDCSVNLSPGDLMDEACAVCYEEIEIEGENEVITTYCSHTFHTMCLLPWLSKKNTCPTCRAVYPLHYSPFLDRQCRKHKHKVLEANV